MNYQFVPVSTDSKAIKEIAQLLRIVFPESNKYSDAFIEWQYKQNPDGEVVGYNAYENGEIVAHYALIPLKTKLFGNEEKGLLSLNTATHPNHRGKKLFTSLAELTYKLATEMEYSFVIGVANANSTSGFVNKLDFQLLGPLNAKLGIGKIVHSKKIEAIQFEKLWTKESIQWQLSNPSTKYKIQSNLIYSATDKIGVEAVLLNTSKMLNLPDNHINIGFRPIKLWIGIDLSINWKDSFYFDIPTKLRPSPLNFIFKDLSLANRTLDVSKVRFNAFDFDAY